MHSFRNRRQSPLYVLIRSQKLFLTKATKFTNWQCCLKLRPRKATIPLGLRLRQHCRFQRVQESFCSAFTCCLLAFDLKKKLLSIQRQQVQFYILIVY